MSVLSGISITCFAASYIVALVLEVSRLFFRSGVRGAIMLGFAGAGFLAHTLYLVYRTTQAAALPLSSSFDWYLLAAWMLVGGYLYLVFYYPRAPIGLFILPLALALIAAAAWFADPAPIASEPASQVWGAIHGIFLLLGTVAVMIGFVAGVMYLMQSARLKRKLPPPRGFRLPSLEWLEKINSRVIMLSALMVAIGFLAGIILKLGSQGNRGVLPWSDPVVWTSAMMLAWLLAAALFNAVYRPARKGRKVAYLTVVSFVFLVISLSALLLVDTRHVGQKSERQRRERAALQRADRPAPSILLTATDNSASARPTGGAP